ncbi:mitochondrial inner membrane protease subunit 1-like isoform X2 [Ctenocephalides felis]|uniref:mitochondrial inner membrane protease subunit 1-like isoform X2 n=1 Tax=Ctenocephalides felis TaxID=7515 RepID=UPI000E6E2F19|nr:mitochondrial inner membrane protease subunit 1-like isoform X2 [Ctenocephalides felis]XP_026461948.1 mitochondrial inner membrane protease subunit 1-like isoform X2 [Ctenocephalides felis]
MSEILLFGPSMEPTLLSNNILFTEHISPKMNLLKKGDIVIAKSPSNPKQYICKRIIGLPGDVIYHPAYVGSENNEIIPRGHVWLEGDNYKNSSDSRKYGPVPLGLIRSRAVFRIWPFQDIKYLKP